MNASAHPAEFGGASFAELAARNRRRALARLILQYTFGTILAICMFFVVRNGGRMGWEAVTAGWPLFVLLFASAGVLRLLNNAQHAELHRWKRSALSVRENIENQRQSLRDRRRGSQLLLALAVVAQFALIPSAWLLDQRGLLGGEHQLFMLIGLCLLPSSVIGLVHGYRLRIALPREQAEVDAMQRQLPRED